MKMRTIDAAIAQLKSDDPGCCLTRHALRRMVLQDKGPHIRCGTKYLINYDGLLALLAVGGDSTAAPKYGQIRRIG